MRQQSGQISMLVLDIEELITENHLLRKINQVISFDFIYDLIASYYLADARPSVDPVGMFKMIADRISLRHQARMPADEEIQLNIAYLWLC